ncbi:MAG: hypothetical protein ABSG63_10460 [Spirochaetia bacterium]|jgi:hypothetical protein
MSTKRKLDEVYAKIQEAQHAPPVVIGRGFTVVGFLSYYLREMPRIVRWAREHPSLVEFSLLRLRPRLRADFRARLNGLLITYLLPAAPYVARILEEGWKWRTLAVRDYNLVVYLADFQKKALVLMGTAGFSRADFHKMTEAFFRLVYHAGQTGALIAVFRKAFTESPEQLSKITDNLACFFAADCLRPSFHDLILAWAIVSSHRSLTWADLLQPDLTLVIPERFYQCSLAVFEMIVMHLQGIERELAALRAERDGIEWLQERIKRTPGELPPDLARFYSDLGRTWHADSGDAFLLLLSLTGGLVALLRELCTEKWQVMTQGEKIVSIRLVNDAALIAEVEKAAAQHEAASARHQLMAPEEISLFRYVDTPSLEQLLVTENQTFVSSRLHGALTILYGLALSLQGIVSGRTPGYSADFYLTRMVVGKPRWRGRPLADVFGFIIEVILQSCSYFKVRALSRDLARLAQIERGIAVREKEKKSLDATGLIGQSLLGAG